MGISDIDIEIRNKIRNTPTLRYLDNDIKSVVTALDSALDQRATQRYVWNVSHVIGDLSQY